MWGGPADRRRPTTRSRLKAVSGHSKWSSIKHKKGAADAKRGVLFTKLARAIQVAAREGGGDPAGNATLANAVQKAKDARMPKDNIERAIAKGTGADADAAAIESVVYEGYGPGGVAILVEALTDNRNRTGSDVRHAFTRHGGSLGEPGSVAWVFEKKGLIVVDAERYSEDDLIVAIDAGAEDVIADETVYEVLTAPGDLAAVREELERAGVELDSAELTMRPTARVEVDEKQLGALLRLLEALEEHDDVAAVNANFDVDASVLERAAA
jgi:YebC/PmpR family DNA-binding regulatory protein